MLLCRIYLCLSVDPRHLRIYQCGLLMFVIKIQGY
jgi:hypothetical protein